MLGKPAAPLANRRNARGAQLAVVEYGIGWTRGLRAVRFTADRHHLCVVAAKAQYLECHLVPARDACRRNIERTLGTLRQKLARHASDITRPGRRPVLIIDDAQGRALLRLPQDGAHEVAAASVDPGRANDEVPAARSANAFLAFELRASVHAERIRCVGFHIRRALTAVEYVVRRVMHEERAGAVRLFGKDAGRRGVDAHGKVRLDLRTIDSRVGGGVDDDIGLYFAHRAADGVAVGEIKARTIGSRRRSQDRLQFRADLASAAGQQHLHAKTSASLKRTASASRFESTGSPRNGHRMPRSESFQRMTRSSSGAQNSDIL